MSKTSKSIGYGFEGSIGSDSQVEQKSTSSLCPVLSIFRLKSTEFTFLDGFRMKKRSMFNKLGSTAHGKTDFEVHYRRVCAANLVRKVDGLAGLGLDLMMLFLRTTSNTVDLLLSLRPILCCLLLSFSWLAFHVLV
jgi:hypothetical protein